MTFSIVVRSADTTMFGVAIVSSSPAVASRCARARAGIGAVASQNITDPALGDETLVALAHGQSAQSAILRVLAGTAHGAYRQLLAIGANGAPAIHSGSQALGVVGSAVSDDAAAAGNLLARADVPAAMVEAFAFSTGHLGERLLRALQAGLERGGEAGPIRSAGLLVVRELGWPIVDLRVDWSLSDPIAELRAIWEVYCPQIDDYVQRAVDPTRAPRFGVPGDS